MTKDGNIARRQAARDLAEAEEVPYTEAVRRIDHSAAPAPTGNATVTGSRVTRPVPAPTTDLVLIGHTAPVISVAFHPDGRTLATSGDQPQSDGPPFTGKTV